MAELINTTVHAELRVMSFVDQRPHGLPVGTELKFNVLIGSISAIGRLPFDYWKAVTSRCTEDSPFHLRPGIGELWISPKVWLMEEEMWAYGLSITPGHRNMMRKAFLEPLSKDQFTYARPIGTRTKTRNPKRLGLMDVAAHFVPSLRSDYRPVAIAVELEYADTPFMEAAVTTLRKLVKMFQIRDMDITLHPTVQYTWCLDEQTNRVYDVAVDEARRQGLDC